MSTTLDQFFPFDAGTGGSASEAQWREMARLWFPTGVVDDAISGLNELAVAQRAAGANMSVDVAAGWTWIIGHFGVLAALTNVGITANATGNPRIDRVVLRADFVNNVIVLDVKIGTPAVSPTAPTLTQDTSMWEISLAQIAVAAGAASIVTANITDERNVIGQISFVNDVLNLADKVLQRPELKDYAETLVSHGNMGATETMDYSLGNCHKGTLDANCVITLSSPPATGKQASMFLKLTEDGTGGWTPTFTNGTYVTSDGSAPTIPTTASKTLFFTCVSDDAGTGWHVFYCGRSV